MKRTSIAALFIFGCGLAGCVSTTSQKPGVVAKKDTRFGVQLPGGAWKKRSFRNADIFLEHEQSGAIIFLNAQCEDLKDSPLEALRAQLLIGFENVQVTKEIRIELDQREALISEVNARMDGVARFLKIMVLRKNRCVYDAVLSAAQNIPAITKDFDDMVASFWAEAKL